MNDLPDLELTLAARPENVGVVRHVLGALGDALRLDAELVDDIRLVVSEACTNVVVHAYPDGAGLMDLYVRTRAEELIVSVCDHGDGMAPRADSPGLGVGLPLMASLAASMELLTPPGGGTEVRMRFPLPDAQSGPQTETARERERDDTPRQLRTRPGAPGPRAATALRERRR